MRLSSTTLDNLPVLQDYGSTYGSGTATHSLALYRHSSGALVFGAGTVQWSWGLDATHDNGSAAADVRMQQATVNLFADMGAQPATSAARSCGGDQVDGRRSSHFDYSIAGARRNSLRTAFKRSFRASPPNSGGRVWGVEVSTDGGVTWQPATWQRLRRRRGSTTK